MLFAVVGRFDAVRRWDVFGFGSGIAFSKLYARNLPLRTGMHLEDCKLRARVSGSLLGSLLPIRATLSIPEDGIWSFPGTKQAF